MVAYAAKHIGQLLGLPIGKDTMRKWMVTAGLWQKPQTAKGRVERCFATAQDRVVKGLLLARARTLAQANEYLETKFLPEWNVRFAALRYKGESLLVELCGPASCKRAEKPSSQPVRKDHNRGGRSSWMRHFPLTQSPAVWKAIQQSNSQF